MKKFYTALLLFICSMSFAQIQLAPLADIQQCDLDRDGLAPFTLTSVRQMLYGTYPQGIYRVSFYVSEEDAHLDEGALPDLFTNTVAFRQVIYVKVWEIDVPENFGLTTLGLNVVLAPVVGNLSPIHVCDTDGTNDGFTVIDLTTKNAEILALNQNPLQYTIRYYSVSLGIIANPEAFINTSNPQELIVTVTDNVTGCSNVTYLTVNVNPGPVVDDLPIITPGCGNLPYDLTTNRAAFYENYVAEYFVSEEAAEIGTDPITNPTQYSSSNGESVYVKISVLNFDPIVATECYVIKEQPLAYTGTFLIAMTTNGQTMQFTHNGSFPNAQFSIDGGPYTTNTRFENLSYGMHSLFVMFDDCGTIVIYPFMILPSPPVGDVNQTLPAGSTMAAIVVAGENLQWYADSALTIPIPIPAGTSVTDGSVYYVTQTIDGYQSRALAVTVHTTAGIPGTDKAVFTVYPNPANNLLNVVAGRIIETMELYAITGQRVLSVVPQNTNTVMDISNLQAGIYLVKAKTADANHTLKIIKQ
jgi:hypothetical protein